MQSALACLELDSHLRREPCSVSLDHVTTQPNLGFLYRSSINSNSNSRTVLISSSFKLASLLAGQLATRRGEDEQYMRIHNETAWVREQGGARGRGEGGERWRGAKGCTNKKGPRRVTAEEIMRHVHPTAALTSNRARAVLIQARKRLSNPRVPAWGAQGVLFELY